MAGSVFHTSTVAAAASAPAKYSGARRPRVASAPLTAGPKIMPRLLAVPSFAMAAVRSRALVMSAA